VVETLALLGPRVSELCGLGGHDADLAAHRLRIPRDATKTDAGERIVPILPALRERIIEHRTRWPYGPAEPIFEPATAPETPPTTCSLGSSRQCTPTPTSCSRRRDARRSRI
jgi:integrase